MIHDSETVIHCVKSSEDSKDITQMIAQLRTELPEELMQKLLGAYHDLLNAAPHLTKVIQQDLTEQMDDPALMTADTIMKGLVCRANGLIREAYHAPHDSKEFVVDLNLAELEVELEEPTDSAIRGIVTMVAETIKQKKDITLSELSLEYGPILQLINSESQKAMVLKTLQSIGYIKPIPEAHWRVDRTMNDYGQRSGLNLLSLFKNMSKRNQKEGLEPMTILEIGPGSGQAKNQRNQRFGENINDYGLSDALYFPIAPIIEKMIDFKRIEKKSGRLNPQEQALIAECIAKTIMIRDNQTHRDKIDYDIERLDQLSHDVNALWPLAEEAIKKLGPDSIIPSTISSRDEHGNVVYPQKIRVAEQSTAFQRALGLLKDNWDQFDAGDLYCLMDIHPENIMIGDMRSIDRLGPQQVDAMIGFRSSVYLRGEEWINFLEIAMERLSDQGIIIDDSVRDNDGWYYRLSELITLQEESKKKGDQLFIGIIKGPGFPTEDHRQDDVPLTFFICKDPWTLSLVMKNLQPGYTAKILDAVVEDKDYLRSLDSTGLTARKVEEVLARQKKKGSLEDLQEAA